MRKELANFVKDGDTCQKTKPGNRKESAGRIMISELFHTWCVNFAGPLWRTNAGNQYLIVAVEQLSKWPVAWAIPMELFNSLGGMKFVKKEIILAFGPPQYMLTDNDLKIDCKAVQDFAHLFNIQWKCTSTNNLQENGVAERIVGTPKKALQKVTQSESKEWDQSLEDVLDR